MDSGYIDFHTHPFLTQDENYCFFKDLFKPDPTEFKDRLMRCNITHICGSVIKRFEPQSFEDVKVLNRHALQLRDEYKGFYTPGFHIHPSFIDESIKEIEFMHKEGLKLVGELVPYMMGWRSFEFDNLLKILEAVNDYGMVVSYHTPWNMTQEQIETILTKFKKINLVGAHPSSENKDRHAQHIGLLKKYDNYWMDISGDGICRFATPRMFVNEVGADRILFGSDYPINSPAVYTEGLKCDLLTNEELEKILYKNAKRLLDIE